jgi:initiation factor 1A
MTKGAKRKGKGSALDSKGGLILKSRFESEGTVSYGIVIKLTGGFNVLVYCAISNREHNCRIPGKMRHKSSSRISAGDLVLVSMRDFQNNEIGDVILRYTYEEAHRVKQVEPEVATLMNQKSSMDEEVDADKIGFKIGTEEKEDAAFDFDAI